MIQAITYMTYWFTFAKTGRRKPFHQKFIRPKMKQILLILGQLTDHGVYGNENTAQCNQPRDVCRVC